MLDELATTPSPPSMTFPATATPYDKAAARARRALVTSRPGAGGHGRTRPPPGVLDGFEEGGLLTVDGEPAQAGHARRADRARRAVRGRRRRARRPAARRRRWPAASTRPAGARCWSAPPTAAAAGGVITALRDGRRLAERVSTVDTADMPAGRVVVVYALREQLSRARRPVRHRPGCLGRRARVPTPAPTATTATSGG